MKNLFLTTIIMLVSIGAMAQKKKIVEVTCPSYSSATLVTYRWKNGTPRNCLHKKAKEEFFYRKRKKFNSIVKMQAPKGKRFANDRKKTQKRLLTVGLVRGKTKQNRPYHWNGQRN